MTAYYIGCMADYLPNDLRLFTYTGLNVMTIEFCYALCSLNDTSLYVGVQAG